MRTQLITALLVIFTFATYGQDQWLVTTKLDTIYGKIYLDTGDPLQADAARIINENGKNAHKAYNLLSVHLSTNKDYKTLKIDGRYQFAKVDLIGEYVSRYLYKDPELSASPNFSLPILENWKGEQYKIGRMTSRKDFAEFMKDCPSLRDQILNRDVKKSKDMDLILLRYNMCIDEARNQTAENNPMQYLSPEEKLQVFVTDLKSKKLYEGDLISMLNDIEQKLKTEQFIPKYLQQVILSQLGDNEEMKAQFLDIIEN
ncbi:MAG: hypothetical protein R8N23_20590 [Reichenbachiella sp.]|uniref:hypothetical protein n=1 Tax=Reichenbachiella sp. TaxID=2184521 RepID=UPI0029663A8E|nr:hypothetical protein [Reichenbachiella sp.]MDW3212281.1 hypothetical protein [Reichenbachiella sp.]